MIFPLVTKYCSLLFLWRKTFLNKSLRFTKNIIISFLFYFLYVNINQKNFFSFCIQGMSRFYSHMHCSICHSHNLFVLLHGDVKPNGGWTLFECCNLTKFDHPQVVFRQRSNVVGLEGYLLCPGFWL